MIKIALVDDHSMLRNGMAEMLSHKGFEVLFEANNGKECIKKIDDKNLPRIILMDINMPLMNGYETTVWLKNNYPQIKVLALSMYDAEENIIKMLRAGACGYMLKDSSSKELIKALETINLKGFYANDLMNNNMLKAMHISSENHDTTIHKFTDRELEFLKLCCSEMGYKEIAVQMNVSVRTVDGYRESLFAQLSIHTRVGLVLYAIKNNIIQLQP